jgi:membrane-bound metal-dependent hydrolase YbcI (DUF457 family)
VALVRATVPRAPRSAWALAAAVGAVVDADAVSAFFGSSAFLAWHRTYTHSLLATALLAALLSVAYRRFGAKSLQDRFPRATVFVTILLVLWLHLAMDACQSEGVALFWPFSSQRIATDWLPNIDPWILGLLLAAILLPGLFRLVSEEIGARDKKPRGQAGAIFALATILLYVGVRATLHSNAIAMLEAHTYRGQLSRRAGAFPEAASLLTWHGIVETERAVHQMPVHAGPNESFNPEGGVSLFKPEPSPALEAARNTEAAKKFLRVARFPKATIEKTETGYQVELRDLRYAAAGETQREIAVVVELDPAGKVINQELIWARDTRRR